MEQALQDPQALQGPAAGWAAVPMSKKLALGAGVILLAALIAVSVMWSRDSDYRVLFSNLSDRDGGAVIAALSQMNVPYKFSEFGGAILVPSGAVHDARLKLASQGLPKGGTVGFELMENQRFGVTQFQERLNFQRGLEGELARSIQALSAVSSARVHLALPNQTGFFRDRQKASASVLLTLHPGRTLDRAQTAGIVHLVASSVANLSPKDVSVVDQNGALLSNAGDAEAAGLDPRQLQYTRQIEASFVQRIVSIIEPIVGPGNVQAQVTANVDFTQSESTDEQYRPNQGGQPAAVRSEQLSESSQPGPMAAAGVPGALSNQPPGPATAPINGPAQALRPQGNGAAAAVNSRRDAVRNYEVDKTVRVTRNASGVVQRVNAAVVINHRKQVDDKGAVTWVPMAPEQLENVTALVKEAIGFSAERGDSVNVVHAPFSEPAAAEVPEAPLWKQPDMIQLARDVGVQGMLVLLGLIVVLTVIRPALKTFAQVRPPALPPGRVAAVVSDDVSLPPPGGPAALQAPEPDPKAQKIELVLQNARQDPAAVANVVRNWVST